MLAENRETALREAGLIAGIDVALHSGSAQRPIHSRRVPGIRRLPGARTGAPITYMAGGKQFIAFPGGGGPLVEELIAVSL
jgi:hypothetical protein